MLQLAFGEFVVAACPRGRALGGRVFQPAWKEGVAPGRKGVRTCCGGRVLGGRRVLQLASGKLGRKGVVAACPVGRASGGRVFQPAWKEGAAPGR